MTKSYKKLQRARAEHERTITFLADHDLSEKHAERVLAVARFREVRGLHISHVEDPEKEMMKRELATLKRALALQHTAIADISKYLRQLEVQQAPTVSFLDEMMASLQAKPDAVTPAAELSQSFVDGLLAED